MAGEKRKYDYARALAPPPLIYLTGLLIGLGLEAPWPQPMLPRPVQYNVGFTLIAVSFFIAAWAFFTFARNKTPIDVYKPTNTIITTGPFRFSRNPLYVSLTLLYIGIAIAVDGVWILAMLVPILLTIHFGVIKREEAYLEANFADTYLAYKARVRRWF